VLALTSDPDICRLAKPLTERKHNERSRPRYRYGRPQPKGGESEPIVPRISQEILAARVGTTRSRINIFMNKFRKLGFIEYDRLGRLKAHSGLLSVIVHDLPTAPPPRR
jgi:hypothetical protein